MAAKKLDKNHGFMRQIVKNQIDRNEYDREMKEQREKMPPTLDHLKPSPLRRKPGRTFYEPPAGSSRTKDEEHVHCPLFKLELVDEVSTVHETLVTKIDDGISVARRIGLEANLPENLLEFLARRVDAELVKYSASPR